MSDSFDLYAKDLNQQNGDDNIIKAFESSLSQEVESTAAKDGSLPEPTDQAFKQVDGMGGFEKFARTTFPEEAVALDAVQAAAAGIDQKETPSKGEPAKSKVSQQEFEQSLPGIIRPLFDNDVLFDPTLGLGKDKSISLGKLTTQSTASVADAVQETGNAMIALADVADNWLKEKGYTEKEFITKDTRLEFVERMFPAPQTTGEKVTRAVAKHVVAVGLLSKAVKGTAAAKSVKITAGSAAFNFFAVDPKEERLSNMVQESGPAFMQPFAAYLATEKDDPELLSRLKNSLESLSLDAGLATAVTLMAKGYKGARIIKSSVGAAQEDKAINKMAKDFERAAPSASSDSAQAVAIEPEIMLSSAKKGGPPRGFTVNVERLTDEQDLQGFIRKVVSANADNIEQFRRGVIGDQELLQRAGVMSADEDVIARLTNLPSGSAVTAEEKLVIDGMFVNVSEQFQKFAKGFNPETASAAQQMEFMNYLAAVDKLSKVSYGTSAELGRGLRATQLVSKMSPINKAKYLTEQVKLMGGQKNINQLAGVIKDLADAPADEFIDALGKIAQKSTGRKFFDAALEVRMNGMLSSAKTLVTGAVSPLFITGPAAIIERGLGRMYSIAAGDAKGVAKGEVGEMLGAYKSEAARAIQSVWGGFEDWIVQASHAIRDGEVGDFLKSRGKAGAKSLREAGRRMPPRMQFGSVVEPNDLTPAISAKAFGFGEDSFLGAVSDLSGAIIRTPVYALSRSDQVVGQLLYNMEKRSLAVRELAHRGIDVTTDEGQQIFQKLISDMPEQVDVPWINEAAKNIREQGMQFSNTNKFTAQLDGMAANIDNLIKSDIFGAPYLRLFMPFSRVELNVLTYGLERFPGLNFLSQKIRSDLAAGGAPAALAKAKMSMGAMFIGSGVTYAVGGQVTGSGPRNKETRKLLEASGWQPNSIKIGGKYYKIDRVGDPFASFLSFGADLADIAETAQKVKPEQYQQLVSAAGAAVMEVMTPEFLTRNLADLLDAINPKNEKSSGQKIVNDLVKSQLPFSALLRDIRKEGLPFNMTNGDRKVRESWARKDGPWAGLQEMLNAVKADLPGYSETLPPRRNMFGDVVHYPAGWGPDEISPVAVMDEVKGKRKFVIDEMVRLGVTGKSFHPEAPEGEQYLVVRMPERVIQKAIAGQMINVDLTPQQYDKYVQYSAGKNLKPQYNPSGRGLTLEDALYEEVKSNWPNLGSQKNTQNKRIYINKLISAYREGAKAQLAVEDTDFGQRYNDMMLRVIDIRSALSEQ